MLRKYAYLLIGAIFASALFTSCDEDDNPIGGGDEINITSVTFGTGNSIYAKEGQMVTVNGDYFGLGEGIVRLSGGSISGSESLTINSWGDTKVEFTLPSTLADGMYMVNIERMDGDDDIDLQIYVADQDPMMTSVATVSVNKSTVLVGWPMLGVEDWDQFEGYKVEYMHNGSMETVEVDGNQVFINDLNEGVAYEFTVYGEFANGTKTNEVMKTWATAERIPMSGGIPVLLFKSDNQTLGSGLDIWDDLTNGPRVLTVANGADWNFGIDTKTTGQLFFGSAVNGPLEYNINATFPGELRANGDAVIYSPADSLTTFEATPNQALDSYNFEQISINLNSMVLGDNRGAMFVARIPSASGYNYARIFIPKDPADGDYLFVDNNDEHVRLYISYQKTAGLPYAGQ